MIPLLAVIISIYCVLRLVEMALSARRQEKDGTMKGFFSDIWIYYMIGAVLIILLCCLILTRGDEVAQLLRDSRR